VLGGGWGGGGGGGGGFSSDLQMRGDGNASSLYLFSEILFCFCIFAALQDFFVGLSFESGDGVCVYYIILLWKCVCIYMYTNIYMNEGACCNYMYMCKCEGS